MAEKSVDVVFRLRDRFSGPMKQFGVAAERVGRVVRRSVARMQALFARLRAMIFSLKTAIVGLVAVWGIHRFWGAFTETMKRVDEIGKLSIAVGESTEFLSEMQHALALSGVGWEKFQVAIKTAKKNIADAADGTGEARGAIAALGLGLYDSEGRLRSVESMLPEIADRLAAMGDATRRAAYAQRLFGESGVDMLRLLNLGSGEIRRMREEAARLGVTISEVAAQRAARFNDAMTRMKTVVSNLFREFATSLGPAISEFLENLTEALVINRDDIVKGITAIGEKIGAFLSDFTSDLRSFVQDAERASLSFRIMLLEMRAELAVWQETALRSSKAWAGLKAFFAEGIGNFGQWQKGPIESVEDAIAPIDDAIARLGNSAEATQLTLIQLRKQVALLDRGRKAGGEDPGLGTSAANSATIAANAEKTASAWAKLKEWGAGLRDNLQNLLKATWDFGKLSQGIATTLVESFSRVSDAIVDGMINGFKDFGKAMKSIVADVLSTIAKMIMQMLLFRAISAGIAGLFPGGSEVPPGFVGPIQGKGGAWHKGVKRFARGGIVNRPMLFPHAGGIGLMGEEGPEAIMPLRRGANGRLGVEIMGGGGGVSVTINQTIQGGSTEQAASRAAEQAARAVLGVLRRHAGLRQQMKAVIA